MRVREFIKRTLTGAAFVVIMISAIIWNPVSLYFLLLFVSFFALYEFYAIFRLRNYDPLLKTGITSGMIVLCLIFLVQQHLIPVKYLKLIILPVMAIWSAFLFIRRDNILDSIIITFFGLAYVILPVSLIPYITNNPLTGNYDPQILLGMLLIIWAYDSFAYIFGIFLGKHKMAPRLSPKKSWEGFIGGAVSAFLLSFLIARIFTLLSRSDWMILSILIILASTAGDLFESLIKREAGVKDSGKFLPGHGGILDRFDSVFFSAPLVFLYIFIFKI